MTPEEIVHLLKANEKAMKDLFAGRGPAFWNNGPTQKWTAGQHVIHLVQSTKPLVKALQLPGWLLQWRFGKSNRPSRTYDEVVTRYKEKLAAAGPGIVGPFSRNMPASAPEEADKWLAKLSGLNDKLNKITNKLHDHTLDNVVVPHPLMGKMTLREILMWNAYHTYHHIEVIREKY